MGYNKAKKSRKINSGKNLWLLKFKENWNSKKPVLLFVLIFLLILVAFYSFLLTAFYLEKIQPRIVNVNAAISNFILNTLGQKTTAVAENIYSAAFNISVKRGCDGVEAMALFAAALLAYPAAWKLKAKNLLIGISLLFCLNIIRIVSLFMIGVYKPQYFETFHIEVWQVIFILVAVTMWIIMLSRSSKAKSHA